MSGHTFKQSHSHNHNSQHSHISHAVTNKHTRVVDNQCELQYSLPAGLEALQEQGGLVGGLGQLEGVLLLPLLLVDVDDAVDVDVLVLGVGDAGPLDSH